MLYYMKKLGHQELGSVGEDGKAKRGRYIYISMNQNVLSLFPPLSSAITNDCALIPIISLHSKKKIYCNYVYHNDKLTQSNGTRNEYRLYLNSELEEHTLLFKRDDIVIFKKDEIKTDDEVQTVYYMDLLSDHTSAIYQFCSKEIEKSPIRAAHCIFKGTISEFESAVEKIRNNKTVDTAIDESVTKTLSQTKPIQMADLFNASSFRDFVLVGYSNLCAVTGTVISWNTFNNLEAAHIKPRSHGGLFLPNNGISMCRDIHWAFDKGFFTIDDNLKIRVHKDIHNGYLKSFDKKSLAPCVNSFFVPDVENLHYHQNNVYGLFKTTGRL